MFALTPPLAVGENGSQQLGSNDRIVPEAWAPSLAEVRHFLEQQLEQGGSPPSQQLLNDISMRLAEVKDAELYLVYVRLTERMSPESRKTLRAEQEQWLKTRTEKAQAAVTSAGGSLAALERSEAFQELTQARLRELQERLTRLETQPQQHNKAKPKPHDTE